MSLLTTLDKLAPSVVIDNAIEVLDALKPVNPNDFNARAEYRRLEGLEQSEIALAGGMETRDLQYYRMDLQHMDDSFALYEFRASLQELRQRDPSALEEGVYGPMPIPNDLKYFLRPENTSIDTESREKLYSAIQLIR